MIFSEEALDGTPKTIMALRGITPNRATVRAIHYGCDREMVMELWNRYGNAVAVLANGVDAPEVGDRVSIAPCHDYLLRNGCVVTGL